MTRSLTRWFLKWLEREIFAFVWFRQYGLQYKDCWLLLLSCNILHLVGNFGSKTKLSETKEVSYEWKTNKERQIVFKHATFEVIFSISSFRF